MDTEKEQYESIDEKPIPVIQAEQNQECSHDRYHPPTDNALDEPICDTFVFDWIDYEEKLFEKFYELYIQHDMELENLFMIVLWNLVNDGIIPLDAISTSSCYFTNNHVFERFMDENVNFVFFGNDGSRQIECCSNMSLSWQGIVMRCRHNSNGWCISHCSHEQLVCLRCKAWHSQTRNRVTSGCGQQPSRCSCHMPNPCAHI